MVKDKAETTLWFLKPVAGHKHSCWKTNLNHWKVAKTPLKPAFFSYIYLNKLIAYMTIWWEKSLNEDIAKTL